MLKVILAIAFISYAVTAPTDNVDFLPINNFALRLLDNTYAYQENFGSSNFALSPVSLWNIFALIAEGSSGKTFQELLKALNLPKDLKSTQQLHKSLYRILQKNDKDVILRGKSAMFSECTLEVNPEFCKVATGYEFDIYSVNPNNLTKLAFDINYYICLATEGRIKKVVDPSNLDNLRLVLVDALYFKGNWTFPFDPSQTRVEPFYGSLGKMIGNVNMMYHKKYHLVGDSTKIGAQILEMNFGNSEDLSMLILLPFDEMPLKKLIMNLANVEYMEWMKEFRSEGRSQKIDTYIPRFKITSQLDLVPPLKYTGIYSVFTEAANLPGVSSDPLFISSTTQTIDIEVTEEGATAAAASVVGLENKFLGNRFEANKEFVFLIIDRKSNVILFVGVYSKPAVV